MNEFDIKAAGWDKNPMHWERSKAIADLYPEDGSFHGEGFKGHLGFNVDKLSAILAKNQFINISYKPCFVINKKISDTETRQFDVFLLISNKIKNNLP